MTEIISHPFEVFVPANVSVLIIGSFPGKEQTKQDRSSDQWYYSAKRNQFWTILSGVYETELKTIESKKELLSRVGIGILDILLKVCRKNNSNLDKNLEIKEYNDKKIKEILENYQIQKIYFTSKFVELHFKKLFPHFENTEYLPSPSPRYAAMSRIAKINYYKNKLPKL